MSNLPDVAHQFVAIGGGLLARGINRQKASASFLFTAF